MAFEHIELRDLNERGATRRPRGGIHAVGYLALGFIAGSLVTILCLAGSTLVSWNWGNPQEYEIKLPDSASTPVPQAERELIKIGVTAKGEFSLNSEPISKDALLEKLAEYAVIDEKDRPRVRIDATRNVAYSQITNLMELCHTAGLSDIGLHMRKAQQ